MTPPTVSLSRTRRPAAGIRPDRRPSKRLGTADVFRTALVNRLRVARSARVILLSAPEGYGKTTLVSQWELPDGRSFAWCSFDGKSSAAQLRESLRSGVARVHGPAGQALGALGRDAPSGTFTATLTEALSSSDAGMVIVIDGPGSVRDREAVRLLLRLIEELPPQMQLVLSSRSRTPIPLARLRARGQLLELSAADLRFSDRETLLLLRGAGVRADFDFATMLNRRLDGWVAGLRLAAHDLAPSDDATADTEAVLSTTVSDYFRARLGSLLDEDEAQFLARVSVLDRLAPPLCDAVADTTSSAELLERLEDANLFVSPLDRDGRGYRLHPVFRAVLAEELDRTQPGRACKLHGRAADWLAQNGDFEAALEHAARGGHRRRLLAMLKQVPLAFTATRHPDQIGRWLAAVDDDALLARNPAAAAAGALAWAMIGRGQEADRWARAAGRQPGRRPGPLPSLLRALRCPHSEMEMVADAQRAVTSTPLGSPWRAPMLLVRAVAALAAGDLSGGETLAGEAADTASSAGIASVAAAARGCQSLAAGARGDFAAANSHADEARQEVETNLLADEVLSLFAFAANARAGLRRGNWRQVRADLTRAFALLPRLTDAVAAPALLLRIEFARVQAALGEVAEASVLLREIEEILERHPQLGVFRAEAARLQDEFELARNLHRSGSTPLTAAELRLLPFLVTHLSFREIGERLYVSRNTVKTQAISVYRKLGVSSRSAAIVRASRLGLVAGRDRAA